MAKITKKGRSRRPKTRSYSSKVDEDASKPGIKNEEPPAKTIELPRLETVYWPQADGRQVVFNILHEDDVAFLVERGYEVILLRTLRLRTPQDVIEYNRHLLRGTIDGTVILSKPQAEALELDMRHRQMLAKVSFEFKQPLGADAPVKEILGWDKSRHTLDNTTVVNQAEMQQLVQDVQKARAQRKALPSPRKKRTVKKKARKR